MRDLWRKVSKVPSFGTFCTLAAIFCPEAAGANTVPPSESDDFSNLTDCESCQIFALVAWYVACDRAALFVVRIDFVIVSFTD